jgi:hypothetical protein
MKKQLEIEKHYEKLDLIYKNKLFFGIDFYDFEERAAIIEFEGNIKLEIAAELAFKEIIKLYSYKFGRLK